MSFGEAISAIAMIKDAISLLKSPVGRNEFAYPNKHFEKIGASLSEIYFPEDEILGVLREIAVNDKDSERHLQRLRKFNDREELINNALENLVLDYGRKARNSIRQSQVIGNIRGRKISLRYAVQSAINENLTFDKPVNRKEIIKLISEIESLNSEIEEAEHHLRQFIGK